jgi:hypothetical protein
MRKLFLTASLLGLLLAACRSADGGRGTVVTVTTTPQNAAEPTTETAVSATPSAPAPEETEADQLLPAGSGPGWTRIEAGGDARCAHDTPYAYWVKPGTVNKLLVYFQGGGGCWSAETCASGSTLYDDAVTPRDDPNGRNGILDWDNPDNPFHNYHAVYIPSCTGDVHWGDNDQTYATEDGGELTIYHRGFVNASTALNWAYENVTTPDSVFVTGCSAGSVGSILFAPYLIDRYPDAAVTQLGDSLADCFERKCHRISSLIQRSQRQPSVSSRQSESDRHRGLTLPGPSAERASEVGFLILWCEVHRLMAMEVIP